MSQWLQSAKATVSAGASVISFTDNKDFASVRAGDVVMINGQIWQCASGTRPDSAGKSTVALAAPWPYTGASNVNAFVFRTTHDLLQLTSDARKLTNITKALLAAQEDILKGTTPTINVPIGLDPATGNEEVLAVTPWQYVINVVNASLGNISAIGAMSQAQFEAIRAQNNELFAASGFVHFGKHYLSASNQAINEGLWTKLDTPNILQLGKVSSSVGNSKTNYATINISGIIFDINRLNDGAEERGLIKFPQAPDGKTTYNKSTGIITNHATVAAAFNAQAADPTNIEVVTDRVDMWGFEAWLEEVSTTNPYVYPNGLIQTQSTTMEGIATSASARPVTYYAVFDGDTGSKGKGLNYFALSDINKKKVLANPKNNLYYLNDGRLVQWRLRQRTIAGAGNGDWYSIDTTGSDTYLRSMPNGQTYVSVKGIIDTTPPFSTGNPTYRKELATGVYNKNTGVYGAYEVGASVTSANRECYFLVCGTVNRLNQGAYHPSFNPSGTSIFYSTYPNGSGGYKWHESSMQQVIDSTHKCFDPKAIWTNRGNISSLVSARPDGRFYDAIYSDGRGGVCRDIRYSANGVDLVDFAEADQKVKNGTYRGFELIEETKILANLVYKSSTAAAYNYVIRFGSTAFPITIKGYLVSPTNEIREIVKTYINSGDLMVEIKGTSPWLTDGVLIYSNPISTSVGGSFLQTDVIGNPANILATPQLANGWPGSWIPVIPDGTNKKFAYTRKDISVGASRTVLYSSNNGTSWTSAGVAFDNVTNSRTSTIGATQVHIDQYQAFAKQTENAANAEVYGGNLGIGEVSASSNYRTENGALLFESLIGKIPVNSLYLPPNRFGGNFAITSKFLTNLGTLDGTYLPEHFALSLGAPNNSSPAIKALNYNVNINQQAFIQYAYTELKHNGTNWGDDGKVTIVDNQSTKTDLNGNTVLVGTAKLKEPIGWIKNKV